MKAKGKQRPGQFRDQLHRYARLVKRDQQPGKRQVLARQLNLRKAFETLKKRLDKAGIAGLPMSGKVKSLYGFGYLDLFESVLGGEEFRKTCPLAMSIPDFATKYFRWLAGLATTSEVLHQVQEWALSTHLYKRYCHEQEEMIKRNWPAEEKDFANLSSALLRALTVAVNSAENAEAHLNYLKQRYGLDGQMQRTEALIGSDKILVTDSRISTVLTTNKALPMTKFCLAAFHREHCTAWIQLAKPPRIANPKEQRIIDLNLDDPFDQFLCDIHGCDSLREKGGISSIRQLVRASIRRLKKIPVFADTKIKQIEEILNLYGLRLGMSYPELAQWERKQGELREKHDALRMKAYMS